MPQNFNSSTLIDPDELENITATLIEVCYANPRAVSNQARKHMVETAISSFNLYPIIGPVGVIISRALLSTVAHLLVPKINKSGAETQLCHGSSNSSDETSDKMKQELWRVQFLLVGVYIAQNRLDLVDHRANQGIEPKAKTQNPVQGSRRIKRRASAIELEHHLPPSAAIVLAPSRCLSDMPSAELDVLISVAKGSSQYSLSTLECSRILNCLVHHLILAGRIPEAREFLDQAQSLHGTNRPTTATLLNMAALGIAEQRWEQAGEQLEDLIQLGKARGFEAEPLKLPQDQSPSHTSISDKFQEWIGTFSAFQNQIRRNFQSNQDKNLIHKKLCEATQAEQATMTVLDEATIRLPSLSVEQHLWHMTALTTVFQQLNDFDNAARLIHERLSILSSLEQIQSQSQRESESPETTTNRQRTSSASLQKASTLIQPDLFTSSPSPTTKSWSSNQPVLLSRLQSSSFIYANDSTLSTSHSVATQTDTINTVTDFTSGVPFFRPIPTAKLMSDAFKDLGNVMAATNRTEDAVDAYQCAVDCMEYAEIEHKPEYISVLKHLAAACKSTGQLVRAKNALDQCLFIMQRNSERSVEFEADLATTIASLARVMIDLDRKNEAIDLLEQCLSTFRDIYGTRHPRTHDTIQLLDSLKSEQLSGCLGQNSDLQALPAHINVSSTNSMKRPSLDNGNIKLTLSP